MPKIKFNQNFTGVAIIHVGSPTVFLDRDEAVAAHERLTSTGVHSRIWRFAGEGSDIVGQRRGGREMFALVVEEEDGVGFIRLGNYTSGVSIRETGDRYI